MIQSSESFNHQMRTANSKLFNLYILEVSTQVFDSFFSFMKPENRWFSTHSSSLGNVFLSCNMLLVNNPNLNNDVFKYYEYNERKDNGNYNS